MRYPYKLQTTVEPDPVTGLKLIRRPIIPVALSVIEGSAVYRVRYRA